MTAGRDAGSARSRSRVFDLGVYLGASLVWGMFAWLLVAVLGRGAAQLSFGFLIEEPRRAGREGGIGSVLVSTAILVALSTLVAVPLAFGAAVLLAEGQRSGRRWARRIGHSLDVLAAFPSIVFGLFGNAFFCRFLGLGLSLLAGGLTLACMVLPLMLRTTQAALLAVPRAPMLAAASLGLGRATTLWRVALPFAIPAVLAGTVLGTARALAETAALIFTSGAVTRMPESLLDSGRALSVHVYELSMSVAGGDRAASASAVVLLGSWALLEWAALVAVPRLFAERGR